MKQEGLPYTTTVKPKPLPNHSPTTRQPLANHSPTTRQPLANHSPTTRQPLANHSPTTRQPLANHSPTTRQPLPTCHTPLHPPPQHSETLFRSLSQFPSGTLWYLVKRMPFIFSFFSFTSSFLSSLWYLKQLYIYLYIDMYI